MFGISYAGSKSSKPNNNFLIALLMNDFSSLIGSIDHASALALIESRRAALLELSNTVASSQAASGGIKHLDYIIANWMSLAMWRSWSDWGRIAASAVLKIPVEGVIPTTNHLESFNAILKRKHLPAWLHSGHRLRFDSLIHILITRILPGIFSHRQAQRTYIGWLSLRFSSHAGGIDLIDASDKGKAKTVPVCWWEDPDPSRDAQAERIVSLKRIEVMHGKFDGYQATCLSSKANARAIEPTRYTIEIHRIGMASCTCQDFIQRGVACKHLRAARKIINVWVHYGHSRSFLYPTSAREAHEIYLKCHPASREPVAPPPPLPMPSVNWSLIQNLGSDTTTVDLNDEHENRESNGRIKDDSSELQSDNNSEMSSDDCACDINIDKSRGLDILEDQVRRSLCSVTPRLLICYLFDLASLKCRATFSNCRSSAAPCESRYRYIVAGFTWARQSD